MTDHGSISTYTNHRCRCDLCRAAHSTYMRAFRGTPKPVPEGAHGSENAYQNYRCRCTPCRAAHAAYAKAYRARARAAAAAQQVAA